MWKTVREIQQVVKQLKKAALSTKLVMNENIMKYMEINKNITIIEQDLVRGGKVFAAVQNYIYSGTLINLIM
jgi:hypothetical protein